MTKQKVVKSYEFIKLIYNGLLIFIIWVDGSYLVNKMFKYLSLETGVYIHSLILFICLFLLFIQNYNFQFIEDAGL